tara:strand:+ start:164 stop:325 length:162 start_codon:yes stop_codon:yes gene_type:complete
MLFSVAIGMAYIFLNYHVKVILTQKDCVWCGTIDNPNIDVEECIENTIPSAVR